MACDDNGVADLIRNHRANDRVLLYAFDLIELNDDDLRRDPLEVRKIETRYDVLSDARRVAAALPTTNTFSGSDAERNPRIARL